MTIYITLSVASIIGALCIGMLALNIFRFIKVLALITIYLLIALTCAYVIFNVINNDEILQQKKNDMISYIHDKGSHILKNYISGNEKTIYYEKNLAPWERFSQLYSYYIAYVDVFRQGYSDNKNNLNYQKNNTPWYSYIYKLFGW